MDRTSHLARSLRMGVSGLVLAWAGAAQALPVFSGNAQASGGASGLPVIRTLGPDLVTVDLNARRTIIDWTSFNLAPGETVSYASSLNQNIVLNRVANGPININGLISSARSDAFPLTQPVTAGGNVWFYSPQGVIFGPNARFVGGALLATSAAVNTTQFLNETAFGMDFTGTGNGGPVTVAAGASFTARGHLALVAPVVTTAAGSVFNAGDYGTVLYGGVDSYRINFITIANDDLSFFDFIVPAGVAGGSAAPTPLNIAGQTTGANVYLSAISRSGLGGMLINAPGLLVGASSFNNYGQVTITTGRNITLGQVNETSSPVVGAQTGDIRVGTITAAGNVNIVSTGTSGAGNVTADRLQIGQGSLITANNLTVGPQGIRTGDSNVFGGGLNLNVSGLVNVPLIVNRLNLNVFSNQFQFNGSISDPSRPADLRFGTVTAGGQIFVSGAQSISFASATAGTEVRLFADGPINVGTLTAATSARIGGGNVITVGTTTATDIDYRSLMGATATNLTASNTIFVGTGGPGTLSTVTGASLRFETPTAQLGTATLSGDAVVRANEFSLTGALTATNFTLEAANGALSVGGTGAGLNDAAFQRIRVSGAVNLYGGVTIPTVNVPTPVYGDVTLRDLSVDPTRVPRLNLFASPTNTVRITGTVRPSAPGVTLQVGNAAVNDPWTPGSILVTGALGTARGDATLGFTGVQAFRLVQLYAKNDILIGSQRFIDLISPVPAADIDIERSLPFGVAATGEEVGKLFVASGRLLVAADKRIVQQNTAATGQQGGLYLTGEGASASEPLLQVGRAQVADLFGVLSSEGALVGGQQLSFSSRIGRLDGDTSRGAIRINGCALGVGCADASPATQFRIQSFRPAVAQGVVDPPILSPPVVDEDERDAETVTTGTGNEEIWRDRK